jgi:hypothetical protein
MIIKITLNELIHLALKQMGIESVYRGESDLLISNHKVEVINVKQELETSAG